MVFFALGIRFSQKDAPQEYALFLFCGLVTFGLFADSVTRAPGLIIGKPNLVKRVVFPLETLPISLVISSLIFCCFGFAVLFAGQLVITGSIPWTVVLLPIVLAPIVFLSLGLAWFLASFGVYVRDARHATSLIVSNLLFFMTPIIYDVERINNETLRFILRLNPLTTAVELTRAVVLRGELPDWRAWALLAAISLVTCQLGYAWFKKTERGFNDVL